ncbi:hypothetical protein Tco_0666993 [Tanacetum coccineum]
MGPSLGITQTTATITSTEDLQRATFTTPPQTAPGTNTTEPPPPPIRNKGPELGADNLTLEGVATELGASDFVSQELRDYGRPAHARGNKKEIKPEPTGSDLKLRPEGTKYLQPTPRKRNKGAERITVDLHVRDRAGQVNDVHSRLDKALPRVKSPPSSDSEDSRRKSAQKETSSSSEDTSNNEDAETGHWKSKNKYREDED